MNGYIVKGTGKRGRKHPKRCTLTIYHIGAFLLLIGIIITLIGIIMPKLFHVYIYDHRTPAKFHQVQIPVGLFSVSVQITWLNMEQITLEHNLEINNPHWLVARATTILGLLAALIAMIVHVMFHICKTNRKWTYVLVEVCCILVAVISILIGLSLAETEIEYIHDYGDLGLTALLVKNGLLDSATSNSNQTDPTGMALALESGVGLVSGSNDFALSLTPPLMSFFLLIAADFLYLLSFLAVLIYFVRICEKAEQERKQLRRAQTVADP